MATTVTLKPNAIDLSGSTSGTTTLQATAVAGTTTVTLPAATDTLVGKATTDTLTNKTLTAPTLASANLTTALTIASASGTVGQVLTSGGSGNAPTWSTVGATPGGSTTQLQYNNAGAFGGISGVTTDGTRITASTTIGVGGATPSTSGSGITFPATQSDSSNANTLDDYEEGTWTPSVGGNATYSAQQAKYTKIGRTVTVTCFIGISSIGTGSTTVVSGLPFTCNTYGGDCAGVQLWSNLANSFTCLNGNIQEAATTVRFIGLTSGTANITNQSTATVFQANSGLSFTGTYTV